MDPNIKMYADSLHEQANLEAIQKARDEKREYMQIRASRSVGSFMPLSGLDIQQMVKIQSEYIERSMTARLESYEKAYTEVARTPTDEDFVSILNECKAIRSLYVKHAVTALTQSIASHGGGVPFLPDEAYIEQSSAHGHDRVLQKWKTWRAKAQLKQVEVKSAEREKHFDGLMPIYNRADFDRDLAELTTNSSESSPYALLFMDLDKFKSINDGPGGHEAGDRALRAFGKTAHAVTEGKGSAYRYGGDEVCVILPNHTVDEAVAVAERIRREVKAIKTVERPHGLSSSIGVASFPESISDPSKLCSVADGAMYASKRAGGNRVSAAEPEGIG
jgi:diguanylate cyclase (GGDEF)-like protein